MLIEAIEKLIDQRDLSQEESARAIEEVLEGTNSHQSAAFLLLMRAKGETVEELHGIIDALRAVMVRVPVSGPVLDIAGTGGDKSHSLNISTASAILAASCGVKVAKHGNRSVSSLSGSADVLEALGINIHKNPNEIAESIEEIGIGFMFAPNFHPAFKQVREVRKELKTRTLFNTIATLLNPASAEHLMIGVSNEDLLETIADLLLRLNVKKSLVFHGSGLDELSCLGPAKVIEVSDGKKRHFVIDPLEFGLKRCTLEDLRGKDAQYNAQKIVEAFEGKESAFADSIALNAGVAAYIYGTAGSVIEGIELAKTQLKEKKVLKLLNQWRDYA